MELNSVFAALNEALSSKDLTIWLQKDDIKKLKEQIEKQAQELEYFKNENATLKERIVELEAKKDW